MLRRRPLSEEGLSILRESAVTTDPLRVPVKVYEDVMRAYPQPEAIDPAYDPEKHRYVGRCCS